MSSISPVDPAPAPPATDEPTWRVTAGIAVAGVLIVALALPASTRTATTGLSRWLLVAAVAVAVLTAAAGLGGLLLRRPGRLPAVVGGLLLVTATALAGAASVAALAARPPAPRAPVESLTVAVSRDGEFVRLTVRAEMPGVAAGALVRAEVTTHPEMPADEELNEGVQVVARQVTVASRAGTVSFDLPATVVDGDQLHRILVESPERQCTATLRPLETEAATVSCTAR